MKTYIVRMHFSLQAASAAQARQRIIDAQESIGEIIGLECSCVDNEDEIEAVPTEVAREGVES